MYHHHKWTPMLHSTAPKSGKLVWKQITITMERCAFRTAKLWCFFLMFYVKSQSLAHQKPNTGPTAQHRPKHDPLFVEHDIEPKIAPQNPINKGFCWRFGPRVALHPWKSWKLMEIMEPHKPHSQNDSVKQKFSQSMSNFTFFKQKCIRHTQKVTKR